MSIADLPFEFLSPPCIHDTEWDKDLVDVFKLIGERNGPPVRLVILDTLGAAFGGFDQNDAGPMSRATGSAAQCW